MHVHSFVELVEGIARIRPHTASEKQPRNTRYVDAPAYKTFKRWVAALRERYSPLPPETTAVVFRFLFPEENIQRKYGLQEPRLAQHLVKILGVSSDTSGRGERLKNWKEEDALGCLGDEVKTVISDASHSQASTVTMTVQKVDALLTELAAKCAFSAASVHQSFVNAPPRRTREAVLTELYTSLGPSDCAVITQIILKDLRPLLYPIPRSATHYTTALLRYNSTAITMLTKEAAMHAWDPSGRLSMIYRCRTDLDEATQQFEVLKSGDAMPQPQVGIPIQACSLLHHTNHAHTLTTNIDTEMCEGTGDGASSTDAAWSRESLDGNQVRRRAGADPRLARQRYSPHQDLQ